MKSSRRIALIAALAAVALTIFVAESQIPPVLPIPGIKLGLANIVTLVAMVILGRRDAFAVLVVRLVLGSMFTGGFSAFLFSAAGGLSTTSSTTAFTSSASCPPNRTKYPATPTAITHSTRAM